VFALADEGADAPIRLADLVQAVVQNVVQPAQPEGPPITKPAGKLGAPETIRTSDQRFRKPLLYPLSYGGK
jgi:hypothetical protein